MELFSFNPKNRVTIGLVCLFGMCHGAWAAPLTWEASVETVAALLTSFGDDISHLQDSAENGAAQTESLAQDSGNIIGWVSVSALADCQDEPNGMARLESTLTCDYFRDYWMLAEYFYQDGFIILDANYVVPGTTAGAVCSVEYEVTFPQNSLTGGQVEWELVITGPYSEFVAGYNVTRGEFGYSRGMLTAVTGYTMHVVLRHGVLGDWTIPDTGEPGDIMLARGTQQVRVELRRIDHPADFDGDGFINLADFSLLSRHWLAGNCDSQNGWCGRTDINRSSEVDAGDLAWLSYYWLINE